MTYFFVSPEQIKQQKVTLTGPDVNHIRRVLRFRPGDRLVVGDGRGKGYRIRISRSGKEIEGVIEEEFLIDAEPSLHITLVQGIPKGDKMELIIQKCTELGVKEIIPLTAQRSIVRLAPDQLKQRVVRWRRVAREAAKQCQRGEVPGVSEPMSLENVLLAMPSPAAGIMPWEGETEVSLKHVLEKASAEKIFLFVGPEGGFTQKEVELAKRYQVVTVSLGKRILRTETAALAAVSMIMYELGDLGG